LYRLVPRGMLLCNSRNKKGEYVVYCAINAFFVVFGYVHLTYSISIKERYKRSRIFSKVTTTYNCAH
jgi:hypothetical protein